MGRKGLCAQLADGKTASIGPGRQIRILLSTQLRWWLACTTFELAPERRVIWLPESRSSTPTRLSLQLPLARRVAKTTWLGR